MITYLKGQITFKHPNYLIVETGGVGYQVFISSHTYAQVHRLEAVKILTFLHIKEDSHTLYGFAEDAERQLFVHLISVSGVGPSTAQLVLSALPPDEVRAAIIGEDVAAFRQVKGIGAKTAKRIILDLKDKMIKDGGGETVPVPMANNTMRQEALSALVALGFSKIPAQKALNQALRAEQQPENAEQLVKKALNLLS